MLRSDHQDLSNFALLPDTKADDPAWTDGDRNSAGAPALDAYVVLSEPRAIRKVVVRSSEVLTCDLYVWDVDTAGWVAAGRKANGPGKMTFDVDWPGLITGVRAEVRASTADEPLRLVAWQEAYAANYQDIFDQVSTRRGRAYLTAIARYGFKIPLPYIDPAEEADLQARLKADEIVAKAKREGLIRAPALIEEIEVLGP